MIKQFLLANLWIAGLLWFVSGAVIGGTLFNNAERDAILGFSMLGFTVVSMIIGAIFVLISWKL